MSLRYEVIMKSNTDYRVFDNKIGKWVYFLVDGDQAGTSKVITHTFLTLDEAITNAEKLPPDADIL